MVHPLSLPGDLIVRDDQIEWSGLLLGAETPYRYQGLVGWEDLPPVDLGDVDKPEEHGSLPGEPFAGERVVTFSGFIQGGNYAGHGVAVQALRAAASMPTSAELPLTIQRFGEKLTVFARLSNRAVPLDQLARVGYCKLTLQWTAADPRRYSVDEHSMHCEIVTPSGTGLVYPLVYPLVYGADIIAASVVCTNAYEADSPPRLVVTGPVDTPLIANVTTGAVLEYGVSLASSSDQLVIDVRAGTVLLDGVDRAYTRTANSGPLKDFVLAAGDNDLEFRAGSSSAGNALDVFWRDATL